MSEIFWGLCIDVCILFRISFLLFDFSSSGDI